MTQAKFIVLLPINVFLASVFPFPGKATPPCEPPSTETLGCVYVPRLHSRLVLRPVSPTFSHPGSYHSLLSLLSAATAFQTHAFYFHFLLLGYLLPRRPHHAIPCRRHGCLMQCVLQTPWHDTRGAPRPATRLPSWWRSPLRPWAFCRAGTWAH